MKLIFCMHGFDINNFAVFKTYHKQFCFAKYIGPKHEYWVSEELAVADLKKPLKSKKDWFIYRLKKL